MEEGDYLDFAQNYDPDTSDIPWRTDNCVVCGMTAAASLKRRTSLHEVRIWEYTQYRYHIVCSKACEDALIKGNIEFCKLRRLYEIGGRAFAQMKLVQEELLKKVPAK